MDQYSGHRQCFLLCTELQIQIIKYNIKYTLLFVGYFQVINMKFYCNLFTINNLVEGTRILIVLHVIPVRQLLAKFLVE
jgi:hypothetical protein